MTSSIDPNLFELRDKLFRAIHPGYPGYAAELASDLCDAWKVQWQQGQHSLILFTDFFPNAPADQHQLLLEEWNKLAKRDIKLYEEILVELRKLDEKTTHLDLSPFLQLQGTIPLIDPCDSPNIQVLNLGDYPITDDELKRLINALPCLRSLTLRDASKLTQEGLMPLTHCPALEELWLGNIQFPIPFLQVRNLVIENSYLPQEMEIYFQYANTLTLMGCRGYCSLNLNKLPQLSKLCIEQTNLEWELTLRESHNLETLSLKDCKHCPYFIFTDNRIYIDELHLRNMHTIVTDEIVSKLVLINHKGKILEFEDPSVETLHIIGSRLSKIFFGKCPKLKEIQIRNAFILKTIGVMPSVRTVPSVQVAHFQNIRYLRTFNKAIFPNLIPEGFAAPQLLLPLPSNLTPSPSPVADDDVIFEDDGFFEEEEIKFPTDSQPVHKSIPVSLPADGILIENFEEELFEEELFEEELVELPAIPQPTPGPVPSPPSPAVPLTTKKWHLKPSSAITGIVLIAVTILGIFSPESRFRTFFRVMSLVLTATVLSEAFIFQSNKK